jgi:hypothetical protein
MTEEAAKAKQRLFTGDKLDWLTALSADPRLDARAFEVGFCIAQHVNKETGLTILSDDTIADKTGIPRRWVQRSRDLLRATGWIDWNRTRTANVYWTRGEQLNAVTDHQILLKDARDERRQKQRVTRRVAPPVAHLKQRDQPPLAHQVAPPVANLDAPPMANIHLSGNTLDRTPSLRRGLSEQASHHVQEDGLPL